MRWEKMDIKGGEMGKWEEKGLGKQYRKGGVSPHFASLGFFYDFPFTRKQLQIIG